MFGVRIASTPFKSVAFYEQGVGSGLVLTEWVVNVYTPLVPEGRKLFILVPVRSLLCLPHTSALLSGNKLKYGAVVHNPWQDMNRLAFHLDLTMLTQLTLQHRVQDYVTDLVRANISLRSCHPLKSTYVYRSRHR